MFFWETILIKAAGSAKGAIHLTITQEMEEFIVNGFWKYGEIVELSIFPTPREIIGFY